jgi:hypothetical protein
MKNKNRSLIFTSALFIICALGCNKDPLDQHPVGKYTTENYWRNEADVLAGINGVYNALFSNDWMGHEIYVFGDQSQNIAVKGDHPDYILVGNLHADPTLRVLSSTWNGAYEQIARANNAIMAIPNVPPDGISDDIRDRSLGEAYFLRAYAYFQLSLIFGEVPLILEENVLNNDYNIAKSSIDSVRAQVESDLLKAFDLLPDSYDASNKGRVSQGTAAGVLCKLYMVEDKLDKAIEYGSKVVNNSNYALAPDYADNFTSGRQEANTELLFQIMNHSQQTPNTQASEWGIYYAPRAWQGWGFHHPTQNFVDEFGPDDTIRKKATLLAVGDSIPNQTNLITVDASNAYQMFAGKVGEVTGRLLPSMTTTGYVLRKFVAYESDGSGQIDRGLKEPVLRSADIYLLVAEAKIRLNGPGSGDAEINAVRNRVNLDPVSNAGMPELIHERVVELGGENVIWQDQLRWDKDKIINLDTIVNNPRISSPLPPYNGSVVVPGRVFTRPKDYYMPIPQVIIDQSGGVITQNPNY